MNTKLVLAVIAGILLAPIKPPAQQPPFRPISADSPLPRFDRLMHMAAWPDYGTAQKGRSVLSRSGTSAWSGERTGFFINTATMINAFSTDCYEANPGNTFSGSRSRIGAALSMTSWELGFSFSAGKIRRWLGCGPAGSIAQFSVIAGTSLLRRNRPRASFVNLKNTR